MQDAVGTPAPALPESRLYTFIDEAREYALHFLEGQRLIHDLAVRNDLRGDGFAYFRDAVLSVQPMIALIKRGEQFGFYIDSADPFFRLKIESGHHGATRCALFPERFREFPEAMRGVVRMQLVFPNNRPPYDSIIHVEDAPLREVVNRVLSDSYQVDCAVVVSRSSDQSAMLHRLPAPGERGVDGLEEVRARRAGIEGGLDRIFERALGDEAELAEALGDIGFRALAHRPVRFRCACSLQRVVRNIRLATGADWGRLFDPGQDALEVSCEYCKTRYRVTREALERFADLAN